MARGVYKTHIPNGETHTLCGLTYKQPYGILPTIKKHISIATCKNCLAKYYENPNNGI